MKTPATTFPLNAWYAAAYDVELKRALLPRTICNKPIVLYRKENGTPAALADACWHRLVPLSFGRLDGDNVVCGYHGKRLVLRRRLRAAFRLRPRLCRR